MTIKPEPKPAPEKKAQAISKAEFIKQADTVCTRSMARARDLQSPETPDSVVAYAKGTEKLLIDAIDDIGEIPLPSGGDRSGAEAFVKAAEKIRPAAERLGEIGDELRKAVERKDRAAAQQAFLRFGEQVTKVDALDEASTKIADEYGMDECAETGETPTPDGPVF